jgi:hypothetical protein
MPPVLPPLHADVPMSAHTANAPHPCVEPILETDVPFLHHLACLDRGEGACIGRARGHDPGRRCIQHTELRTSRRFGWTRVRIAVFAALSASQAVLEASRSAWNGHT